MEEANDNIADPKDAAESASLSYVTDEAPGITRRKSGKGWSYRNPENRGLKDWDTIEPINTLAVPPASTAVGICPHPNGHLG